MTSNSKSMVAWTCHRLYTSGDPGLWFGLHFGVSAATFSVLLLSVLSALKLMRVGLLVLQSPLKSSTVGNQ